MPPLLELNVFTVLLFVAVGLLVWFLLTREISSTRRMKCMMAELGLDYDLAATADPEIEAIIRSARGKCMRCRSEGLCERWLDAVEKGAPLAGVEGVVSGPLAAEDFCPNAGTFRALAEKGALQVEPAPEPEDGERIH